MATALRYTETDSIFLSIVKRLLKRHSNPHTKLGRIQNETVSDLTEFAILVGIFDDPNQFKNRTELRAAIKNWWLTDFTGERLKTQLGTILTNGNDENEILYARNLILESGIKLKTVQEKNKLSWEQIEEKFQTWLEDQEILSTDSEKSFSSQDEELLTLFDEERVKIINSILGKTFVDIITWEQYLKELRETKQTLKLAFIEATERFQLNKNPSDTDQQILDQYKNYILLIQNRIDSVIKNKPAQKVKMTEIKPKLTPRYFSGDTSEKVNSWFTHFEKVATTLNWSDATKLQFLPIYLCGEAQNFWDRRTLEQRPPTTYAGWVEEIKKRFYDPNEPEVARRALFESKQTQEETPRQYLEKIIALCFQADANMSEAEKIRWTKNGLNTGILKMIGTTKTETLDDLRTALGTAEQTIGLLQARKQGDQKSLIEKLQKQVAQLELTVQKKNPQTDGHRGRGNWDNNRSRSNNSRGRGSNSRNYYSNNQRGSYNNSYHRQGNFQNQGSQNYRGQNSYRGRGQRSRGNYYRGNNYSGNNGRTYQNSNYNQNGWYNQNPQQYGFQNNAQQNDGQNYQPQTTSHFNNQETAGNYRGQQPHNSNQSYPKNA